MRSYFYSTPYTLNLKLKKLYPVTRNNNINMLYKNLNDSIPELTNQFCCLKNRTQALNKSLNKIPIVYNNSNFTTNRSYRNYFSKSIKTTPNATSSYYNYSYISPKPIIKSYPYQNSNINKFNNINYKNKILNYNYDNKYKYANSNLNDNNQIKLHFNYDTYTDNPIKNYNKLKNRNYSAINMIRNNYKDNKYHNLNSYDLNNNNDNYSNLNYNFNYNKANEKNKNEYEEKFQKLNNEINEKDKIIHHMQGVLDDTMDELNKKNHENSILQSEILELKAKSNYEIKNNINDLKNNNDYEKENKTYNNSYIQERIKKNRHRRKNYNINNQKYNTYNKSNNNNDYHMNKLDSANMDLKWEEIRKLNKKMDNLLYKNENKLKKYENINNNKY
jgi:hypothetical protein